MTWRPTILTRDALLPGGDRAHVRRRIPAIDPVAAATGTFARLRPIASPCCGVEQASFEGLQDFTSHVPLDLLTAAREAWDQTCAERENGVKNSQISVLSPPAPSPL